MVKQEQAFTIQLASLTAKVKDYKKTLKNIKDMDCHCSLQDGCGICLTECNELAEEALQKHNKFENKYPVVLKNPGI